MYKYSEKSIERINTCHQDLKTIFSNVLKYYDHTIVYGKRTKDQQNNLYKQGREFVDGEWVTVNKSKIVTFKQWPESKHNTLTNEGLSIAVDAAPFIGGRFVNGGMKQDIEQIYHFVGFVQGVASKLYDQGLVLHKLRSGADWNDNKNIKDQTFNDLMHFELIIPKNV